MAVEKRASAVWKGNLTEGSGVGHGRERRLPDLAVSWPKRAEQGEEATSPEELIAAAHAACYCMALSHGLAQGGNTARGAARHGHGRLPAGRRDHGQPSRRPGPGARDRRGRLRRGARPRRRENCPVSKALAGVEITHTATLV